MTLPFRWLRGSLLALTVAGPLSAQGQQDTTGEAELRAGSGDRFASWVASRELFYPSVDDRGAPRAYSGRVYFPSTWLGRHSRAVPLVVYVHATTEPGEVPLFNRGDEVMVGAMAAYLHNFVVAMPDLPGYGHDATPRPHPYCHAQSLATSVLDMIRPALELLAASSTWRWDGRIFLAGYSAGGYGALAAVKEWQANPGYADLPLTAAACMAGPFHFSESTRAFLTEGLAYQRPDLQAMLLRAYHDLYPDPGVFAPERALNGQLLEEKAEGPDEGSLPQWLGSGCNAEALRRKIQDRLGHGRPIRADDIMNPEWVKAQLAAPAWPHTEVGRRLRENDLVGGWHPTIPILLATSPADECVPPSNTFALMKDWRARGCTAPVQLYPLTLLGKGMSHAAAGGLAVEKAFRWFGSADLRPPALLGRP